MQKHRIGSIWSGMAKGLLNQGNNVLIEAIYFSEVGPCMLICTTLPLLSATLEVINARVELKDKPQEQI